MELARRDERVVLTAGQPAPAFDLPDADLNIVSLEQFKNNRSVVVYFYVRDDTPGCTIEGIDFAHTRCSRHLPMTGLISSIAKKAILLESPRQLPSRPD